jgi:hypothetical protein
MQAETKLKQHLYTKRDKVIASYAIAVKEGKT